MCILGAFCQIREPKGELDLPDMDGSAAEVAANCSHQAGWKRSPTWAFRGPNHINVYRCISLDLHIHIHTQIIYVYVKIYLYKIHVLYTYMYVYEYVVMHGAMAIFGINGGTCCKE